MTQRRDFQSFIFNINNWKEKEKEVAQLIDPSWEKLYEGVQDCLIAIRFEDLCGKKKVEAHVLCVSRDPHFPLWQITNHIDSADAIEFLIDKVDVYGEVGLMRNMPVEPEDPPEKMKRDVEGSTRMFSTFMYINGVIDYLSIITDQTRTLINENDLREVLERRQKINMGGDYEKRDTIYQERWHRRHCHRGYF
jgi:hypothetical protein